nr:Wadjet anti-phage system protein JetD domain-containing protein [Frateuria flava]
MLLAGDGTVDLAGTTLPLVRPYLGLPVERVQAVATRAACVLTIENLATFHEAAVVAAGAPVLLIYTGGMPSPAWRAAYVRILRGMDAQPSVLHWGDIDEGGFRIAAVLAQAVKDAACVLRPWMMSPADLPPDAPGAREPTAASLARMCRWAERAGWNVVAEALRRRPVQLEQESLVPLLPTGSVCTRS